MNETNLNGSDERSPVRVRFDEDNGFLLVQLDKGDWGFHDQNVQFQDKVFQPKSELHITILSGDAAEMVKDQIHEKAEVLNEIRGLIDSIRWFYKKLDAYYHIRDGEKESIIQMVELPELTSFFSELSRITGKGIVLPPTHVTLYIRNSENGIGLPTREVFDQLAQARINREDFLL